MLRDLGEKIYTLNDVLRILNVPRHRLFYLFESRKLRKEDLLTLPNGHKVYRESDIERIRQALFEVGNR